MLLIMVLTYGYDRWKWKKGRKEERVIWNAAAADKERYDTLTGISG